MIYLRKMLILLIFLEISNLEKLFAADDREISVDSFLRSRELMIAIGGEDVDRTCSLLASRNVSELTEKLIVVDENRWTPLHVLAQKRNAELIDKVFNIMQKLYESEERRDDWVFPLIETRNNYDDTPLHVAAYEDNRAFLERVIHKFTPYKWRINQLPGHKGNTLVHTATAAGHDELVRYLLCHFTSWEEDYDIAKTTTDGHSALDLAILNNKNRVFVILINHSYGRKGHRFDFKRASDLAKRSRFERYLSLRIQVDDYSKETGWYNSLPSEEQSQYASFLKMDGGLQDIYESNLLLDQLRK